MPLDALDDFLTGKSQKPESKKKADTGGTTTAPDDLDAFLTGKAADKKPDGALFEGYPEEAFQADYATKAAPLSLPPSTVKGWRAALEPPPGQVRLGPFPLTLPETSPGSGVIDPNSGIKGLGFDWKAPFAAIGNPLLDFLEGTGQTDEPSPLAGTVSPSATMLLLGGKAGSPNPFKGRDNILAPPKRDIQFGPPNALDTDATYQFGVPKSPYHPDSPNYVPPGGGASPVEGGTTVPGGSGGGSPDMGPAPVGAQVSPSHVVGLTPEETTIYRSTAEGQKWLEPQPVGVPDTNIYVRGVNPTRVESEQSVNTARELKDLGVKHPEVSQEARLVAEEHNEFRGQHYDENSGSGHDIHAREQQREADIERDKPQVFARSRSGDPTAVVNTTDLVAHIRAQMADPMALENPAVQSSLQYVLDRLVNKDGTPRITNPEQLWGLRHQVDKMTSKRMQADDTDLHYAAGHLNELKPMIDAAIEPAATGFGDMIANYKRHSDAIDTMRLLQDAKNGLYVGSGGRMRMSYEKFNAFMRNVVKMRNPQFTSGINDFQKLTDAQMDSLWALRDDLRRSASALELARTAGSDTIQNLWDMMKGLATGPEAQAALHGFAATHFGAPGVIATTLGKRIIGPIISGRAAARGQQRGMDILRPPPPEPNILNQAP